MFLERVDFLFVGLGLLEVQVVGSVQHEVLIVLDNFIGPAFQQIHNLLYISIVLLDGYFSYAAAGASSDVKIEARAELAAENRIRGNLVVA